MPPHVHNVKEGTASSGHSVKSTLSSYSVPTDSTTDTNRHAEEKVLGQTGAPCEGSNSSDKDGIPIPLFLQPIFGLDLLPASPAQELFKSPSPEPSESQSTREICMSPSMPERSEETQGDLNSNRGRSLTDSLVVAAPSELVFLEEEVEEESEGLNDDISDHVQGEQKKKRRSALGRFKSKVRKAKQRRNHRRGRLGSATSTSSCIDDVDVAPDRKALNQDSSTSANSCADDKILERQRLDSHTSHTLSTLVGDASPSSGARNIISGSAEDQLAWVKEHASKLDQYKEVLSSVVSETQLVSARTDEIQSRIADTHGEIRELELQLDAAIKSLQLDAASLDRAQKELCHLEQRRIGAERDIQATAAVIRNGAQCSPPQSFTSPQDCPDVSAFDQLGLTPRASNLESPSSRRLHRTPSSSFMRVSDLDMEINVPDGSSLVSSAGSSLSLDLPGDHPEKLFFVDNDASTVLEALSRFGYDMVTDESDFFKPVRDTERILSKRKPTAELDPSCPVHPWHYASGKEILVWSGIVNHGGYGSNMPVMKARGIVRTRPRQLVDLILDSSRVKEYNKMSLGRTDVVCLQEGVDTTADDSAFGLPGEVKITRSVNKPPMIRKNIELLSLMYARSEGESYLMVSRSVWENAAPNLEGTKDAMRTEMLLGVNFIRPVNGGDHCEMTTITHVYSPSVPEMLAKSFAPKAAANFIRDIQAVF